MWCATRRGVWSGGAERARARAWPAAADQPNSQPRQSALDRLALTPTSTTQTSQHSLSSSPRYALQLLLALRAPVVSLVRRAHNMSEQGQSTFSRRPSNEVIESLFEATVNAGSSPLCLFAAPPAGAPGSVAPVVVYSRRGLLSLYNSPLVPAKLPGMKDLSDWYGSVLPSLAPHARCLGLLSNDFG